MDRKGYATSDLGLKRQNNEDSFAVYNGKIGSLPNLYIIADGMGGHNAGEIASQKAIDYCMELILTRIDIPADEVLTEAILYANKKVYELSKENPAYYGMGTTFTACFIDGNSLYYAHVGDSRMYLISGMDIKQITEDHTLINEMIKNGEISKQEAAYHPQRNMITRALGTDHNIMIDTNHITLSDTDKIIMCSDGLSNMTSDDEILLVAKTADDNEKAAAALVKIANENGGADNISIIIL